jgi:hypothetical protein
MLLFILTTFSFEAVLSKNIIKLFTKSSIAFRHMILYLHPEKCKFEQAKVDYLDLAISHGKVSMDSVKIEAVINWPILKSLKEVRSFIGFANFD